MNIWVYNKKPLSKRFFIVYLIQKLILKTLKTYYQQQLSSAGQQDDENQDKMVFLAGIPPA